MEQAGKPENYLPFRRPHPFEFAFRDPRNQALSVALGANDGISCVSQRSLVLVMCNGRWYRAIYWGLLQGRVGDNNPRLFQ